MHREGRRLLASIEMATYEADLEELLKKDAALRPSSFWNVLRGRETPTLNAAVSL